MSWTDKKALQTIKKLRDEFSIHTMVETGTFKGVNAAVHAANFDIVLTCEKIPEYFAEAKEKLKKYPNVAVYNQESSQFLRYITSQVQSAVLLNSARTRFFYLDAHFYDPTLNPEDRFVVLKELEALKGYTNCVIAIHDFKCNGLGHIVYDGQPLDFELVKSRLNEVNPNFSYYFNYQEACDILTKERVAAGEIPNLELDSVTSDNIDYAWTKPEKTYRGILYATPKPLDLTKYELKESDIL